MAKVDVTITQGGKTATLADGFTYLDPVTLHSGDSQTASGSSSVTVNSPTNLLDGDLVLLIQHDTEGVGSTFPAGFTEIVDQKSGSFDPRVRVAYKIASSEPSSYTVGVDNWAVISSHRVTGFNASTPIGANTSGINGSGTSASVPGFTANAGSLLVSAISSGTSDSGAYSISGGSMSIITDTRPDFARAGVATETDIASGATGSRDWSWSNSVKYSAVLFEING